MTHDPLTNQKSENKIWRQDARAWTPGSAGFQASLGAALAARAYVRGVTCAGRAGAPGVPPLPASFGKEAAPVLTEPSLRRTTDLARQPTARQAAQGVGSTGSIGTQTLDLVRARPDRFEVTALATGSRSPSSSTA